MHITVNALAFLGDAEAGVLLLEQNQFLAALLDLGLQVGCVAVDRVEELVQFSAQEAELIGRADNRPGVALAAFLAVDDRHDVVQRLDDQAAADGGHRQQKGQHQGQVKPGYDAQQPAAGSQDSRVGHAHGDNPAQVSRPSVHEIGMAAIQGGAEPSPRYGWVRAAILQSGRPETAGHVLRQAELAGHHLAGAVQDKGPAVLGNLQAFQDCGHAVQQNIHA